MKPSVMLHCLVCVSIVIHEHDGRYFRRASISKSIIVKFHLVSKFSSKTQIISYNNGTTTDADSIYLDHRWSLADRLSVPQAQGLAIVTQIWPAKGKQVQAKARTEIFLRNNTFFYCLYITKIIRKYRRKRELDQISENK